MQDTRRNSSNVLSGFFEYSLVPVPHTTSQEGIVDILELKAQITEDYGKRLPDRQQPCQGISESPRGTTRRDCVVS